MPLPNPEVRCLSLPRVQSYRPSCSRFPAAKEIHRNQKTWLCRTTICPPPFGHLFDTLLHPSAREFLGIPRLVTGGGDRVRFAISSSTTDTNTLSSSLLHPLDDHHHEPLAHRHPAEAPPRKFSGVLHRYRKPGPRSICSHREFSYLHPARERRDISDSSSREFSF